MVLKKLLNFFYFQCKANILYRKKIIFEAKRTHQIERKLFSKRSEHIREKENNFRSEANILDRKKVIFEAKANTSVSKKIIFEAKGTHQIERKLVSTRSEHISQKENYFRSKANTFDSKKIIFEAKRTLSTVSKLFSKRSDSKYALVSVVQTRPDSVQASVADTSRSISDLCSADTFRSKL